MTRYYTPRGLPVSTRSPALARATHDFEEQVLDYGSQAAALFEAVPLDPDCALATSYAAALHLFRSTSEGHERARPLATTALRLVCTTERETSLTAAIARWASGDIPGAVAILAAWTAREPADLFAVKLLQHLLFSRGDTAAMLGAIGSVAAAVPNEPRVLGMLAFALDQNGRHGEAEAAARAPWCAALVPCRGSARLG